MLTEVVLRHARVMSVISLKLLGRQKRPTASQLETASDVQVLNQYNDTFSMNKVVATVPWWTSASWEVNSIIHQPGPDISSWR